jgi:hypothetical protein
MKENDENECCKEDEKDCSKDDGDCCGGCHEPAEEINLKELGPEAEELAGMFDEVNDHLNEALKARHKILETVHAKASESPEMKEKLEKVIKSRHPVLIQFVFGMPEQ